MKPSHRPGDQAADVGGVVDVAAGAVEAEPEQEVDDDEHPDLADHRPTALIEHPGVDPGRCEDDAEQPEDRARRPTAGTSGSPNTRLAAEPAAAHRTYMRPKIFQP